MTLPYEPRLNPPEITRKEDRALLAAKLTAACQAVIQAAAMIASDDNAPDESMTWEDAQKKLVVLDRAVMDLQRPVIDWTFQNDERGFWENKLREPK